MFDVLSAATPAAGVGGYASNVWPFMLTGLLLLTGGLASWVAGVWWTGRLMHRPPRLTPPRAFIRLGRAVPSDLGLAYADEVFDVPDVLRPGSMVRLDAWRIPAAGGTSSTVALLLHGYGDARPGVLPWTRVLADAGLSVVMIDLRAHGTSGGDRSGGGWAERHDVAAVVRQLAARGEGEIVLAGISFGGLVAAAVAADDAGDGLVAGVLIDSPIGSWHDASMRWGDLFSLPPRGHLAHALRLRLTLDPSARRAPLDLVRDLSQVRCPGLVVLPGRDVLLTAEDADEAARSAAASGLAVWRPDVAHNRSVVDAADAYVDAVARLASDVRRTRQA